MVGPGHPPAKSPEAGMDRTEANYYRAMHYLAGALWFMGAGEEALAALNELVAKVKAKTNGEHGGR